MVTPRVELGPSALQADAKSPSAKPPGIHPSVSVTTFTDRKTSLALYQAELPYLYFKYWE